MKTVSTLLITACILFAHTANAAPKVKKETIVVKGKLGVIKEQRVKSVQSTISYTPTGGAASYNLINLSDTGASGVNEHIESEELTIPSWTLFSW